MSDINENEKLNQAEGLEAAAEVVEAAAEVVEAAAVAEAETAEAQTEEAGAVVAGVVAEVAADAEPAEGEAEAAYSERTTGEELEIAELQPEVTAPVEKPSNKTTVILVCTIVILLAVIAVFIWMFLKDKAEQDKVNQTNTVVSATDGLGTDNTLPSTSGSQTDSSIESQLSGLTEYKVEVTLGQYKGLEAHYNYISATADDVSDEIANFLENMSTDELVTDRGVEEGDTANIDFVGYMDGVEFPGGAGEDFDLEIGSGSFIPGFESGLVGAMTGDEVTLDISFPDPYPNNPDLSGKPVTFVVTVNSITERVIPELNDAFIEENTSSKTVEEYRQYVEEYLNEERKAEADDQASSEIFEHIIKNSTFTGDIDAQINDYAVQYMQYWDSMAQAYYGMDGATLFLYTYGVDADSYRLMMYEEAEYSIKYQHVLDKICEVEGLTVTPEEYEKNFTEIFMDYYGFESKEEVLKEISQEEADEMVNSNVLREKAKALVMDSSVLVGTDVD